MAREAQLTIATGVKSVGKTYTTFKTVYVYSKGIPENGFYPRKVLIFDINNEYQVFTPSPEDPEAKILFPNGQKIITDPIDFRDTILFSGQKLPEIRRISPVHTEFIRDKKGNILARPGDEWSTDYATGALLHVIKNFRGGLLLIEDLSSLFGDSIPRDIMGLITRNRHRDLDIIMHLQSIAPILPRFWQNCGWTRFHKQNDGVDKSKRKLEEKYVMYKIVEKLVDRQYYAGNKRYHVWVNNLEMYIQGHISQDMALQAIKDYLSENRNEMRYLENKRDDSGRRLNNYQAALQIRTDQLYNQYFRKIKQQ